MLIEFRGQPELGIWKVEENRVHEILIVPHKDVPPGLVTLSECATISVNRTAVRLHTPTQTERLF